MSLADDVVTDVAYLISTVGKKIVDGSFGYSDLRDFKARGQESLDLLASHIENLEARYHYICGQIDVLSEAQVRRVCGQ